MYTHNINIYIYYICIHIYLLLLCDLPIDVQKNCLHTYTYTHIHIYIRANRSTISIQNRQSYVIYDDDDFYLNKLQREVLQNLWSEYMNNADQPI
jgi:hypothetical protein